MLKSFLLLLLVGLLKLLVFVFFLFFFVVVVVVVVFFLVFCFALAGLVTNNFDKSWSKIALTLRKLDREDEAIEIQRRLDAVVEVIDED